MNHLDSWVNVVKSLPQTLPQTTLIVQSGRPSPIASHALGSIIVRILSNGSAVQEQEYTLLQSAIQVAMDQPDTFEFHGGSMGGDEVLYGRAGLLWALIQIHNLPHVHKMMPNLLTDHIPIMVDSIILSGKHGAKKYLEQNGPNNAMPLMWPWIDNYYSLGA
jgi:hypothetical protein